MMRIILALLVLVLLPLPAQATEFQQCFRCHQAELELGMLRLFVHAPFREQRCAACHRRSEASAAPPEQRSPAGGDEHGKIQWLGNSMEPDTSHWFLLTADKIADVLLVEMRGPRGPLARRQITVPPPAGMTAVADTGRPPVISGVRVTEVRRGLFLSATIAWETDTVSDAMVRYGRNRLDRITPRGTHLSRRHQVVLHELEPNRTYNYAVVAGDLWQRESTSEPQTFSTARPVTAPLTATPDPAQAGREITLRKRFQRLGDDYLLELTTDRPVALAVGVREGTPVSPRLTGSETGTAPPDDDAHADLSPPIAANMLTCSKCHNKISAGATHPVNVYPSRGMVIPPEYPTLPDGRITCNSCHEHHGSSNNYRLRKANQRELCIGCHQDMR